MYLEQKFIRKIYKKQLNKAYYEYINNLIETVQISLRNFGDL